MCRIVIGRKPMRFNFDRLRVKQANGLKGVLCLLLLAHGLASFAAETTYKRVYDASANRYVYVPERTLSGRVNNKARSAWRNPVVKQAAIGTAVGAVAGGISGRSSALKGAGVGALVGAGTGLMDSSRVLDGKPMVKTTLKGAAIGTGASVINDSSVMKGAAIGGAAGAGTHLIRDWMNR
jgi:hypothetical protein